MFVIIYEKRENKENIEIKTFMNKKLLSIETYQGMQSK